MKAKFILNPIEFQKKLETYKDNVRAKAESEIRATMFDPVIETSIPYAPEREGGFIEEMEIFNGVRRSGKDRFMTRIIIDPENEEWNDLYEMPEYMVLDMRYPYLKDLNTEGRYGLHAYYNSFSGTSAFFRVSMPKAMKTVYENIGKFVVRGGL